LGEVSDRLCAIQEFYQYLRVEEVAFQREGRWAIRRLLIEGSKYQDENREQKERVEVNKQKRNYPKN
jgi:hypothetical protein